MSTMTPPKDSSKKNFVFVIKDFTVKVARNSVFWCAQTGFKFTRVTNARHAYLPILSCQNATKFETFDVHISASAR